MKVLLLSADAENLWKSAGPPGFDHLGLAYLSGALSARGHAVTVDSLVRVLSHPGQLAQGYGIVGVSVMFQNHLAFAVDGLRRMRSHTRGCHLTAGGHPVTMLADDLLVRRAEVDSIVRGEGEETLVELATLLEQGAEWRGIAGISYLGPSGSVHNPPRPLVGDLDSLPPPSRTKARVYLYRGRRAISVLSSRGCYARCSFCSVSSFYRLSEGRPWRSQGGARRSPRGQYRITKIHGLDHSSEPGSGRWSRRPEC